MRQLSGIASSSYRKWIDGSRKNSLPTAPLLHHRKHQWRVTRSDAVYVCMYVQVLLPRRLMSFCTSYSRRCLLSRRRLFQPDTSAAISTGINTVRRRPDDPARSLDGNQINGGFEIDRELLRRQNA